MSEAANPDYLTPEQIAAGRQISQRTLRDWMRKGLVPFYKFGRLTRIARKDAEAWDARHLHNGRGR